MAYAQIEQKIHSLLEDALDSDISVTRGFHQPNTLKSVAIRPGAASRLPQGERGRVSTWTIEIAMMISSGLDLSEWHSSVLEIRQTIVDLLDGYPTLGMLSTTKSQITGCMVTTIETPDYSSESRVHKFEQVLLCEVKEVATISTGEYA